MVFGLFKRSASSVTSKEVAIAAREVTRPDENRSKQLGPILWQDVNYGMTVEEVKAVRQDVIRSPRDEKLGDGTTAALAIPHLRLGSHNFTVLFYFTGRGLTQVTIKSNGKPLMSDFHDLTGALRLRYGREAEMNVSPDSISTAEWLSPEGINVNLVCFPAADILNVNFQFRYADTALQL